jgi:hypothetical protein
MPPLADADLAARFAFLLTNAGPCRACELGEFVGVPTFDAQRVLAAMRQAGLVVRVSDGIADRWRLSPSPPPQDPQPSS